MKPQHQRVVDKLVTQFGADNRYLAMFVGGSIAKGWEREDSDVDVMFIVTPEEFARRREALDLFHWDADVTDYENGYVDGKILDRQFLVECADHGSEPARSAFANSITGFCHDKEVLELVASIPVYQEAERDAKLRSFYSRMLVMQWYIGEAEKRDDRYLLLHCASELTLFTGRLILAFNRILYPYHKWFMRTLESAPEQPAALMETLRALLNAPSVSTADAVVNLVLGWRDWGFERGPAFVQFLLDGEWNWRDGPAPLADR